MQLNLYVGTLTEFFHEPLAQEAEAEGHPAPDVTSIRQRVADWRQWISEGLHGGGHLTAPLSWDETATFAPARHPIELDAVRALKLWLAYDARSEAPAELPERPELDPRWRQLAEHEFRDTAWDQILVPELWLPGAAAFTFPCPYPDGHEVQAGWSGSLLDQLRDLHERRLSATPLDALRAAKAEPLQTRELTTLARRAAGILLASATEACERSLPMLLAPA